MHGAKRVVLFCLMTAVIPTILIIIPLYLRHVVFADVVYEVAESDILAIQEGVSSIFCKSLSLKMNSSFNAFQLRGNPTKSEKIKHIRLKKSMSLPDDTLEYWGFYLLKGSIVKLRVCSRFDGARIMVVRGDKNLDTCNLMKHEKVGAKMDAEYNKVKAFYEKPAEVVAFIDLLEDDKDENKAEEDLTSDSKNSIPSIMEKTREKKGYFIDKKQEPIESSDDNDDEFVNTKNVSGEGRDDEPRLRHARSHLKEWKEKVEQLKKSLEDPLVDRPKRSISPLDSHIKHGGNAMNSTVLDFEGDSASSFETDLRTCYDGKIFLSRSFQPSPLCNNIAYLYRSNHMVTEQTVASDGYYYYIFYSDNDFVKNDMHAVFDIYKPTYGFKNSSSGRECINQTTCRFPLQLLGGENVIVEVPTRDGIEHEGDDITLLTSICEPRMEIYVIFPILVMILIMSCSFL